MSRTCLHGFLTIMPYNTLRSVYIIIEGAEEMTIANINRKSIEQQKSCSHIWLIDSPDGPWSRGVCRLCGAEKDFMNSPMEIMAATKRSTKLDRPNRSGRA